MARQLCCRGMCKNLLRSDGQQRNYGKAKFPSNLNCGQKTVSETGPWRDKKPEKPSKDVDPVCIECVRGKDLHVVAMFYVYVVWLFYFPCDFVDRRMFLNGHLMFVLSVVIAPSMCWITSVYSCLLSGKLLPDVWQSHCSIDQWVSARKTLPQVR